MVQQSRISLSQLFALLVLSFVVLFALSEAAAWSGPTGTPPNNNVAQPINISAQDQVKQGGLGVSALAIFGDGLIQANGHLNFGTTAGNSGYGFRDNSGTMEYKDQGGSWISFKSLAGSGTNGTNGTNGSTPQYEIFSIVFDGTTGDAYYNQCPAGTVPSGTDTGITPCDEGGCYPYNTPVTNYCMGMAPAGTSVAAIKAQYTIRGNAVRQVYVSQ